jgi:membrane associated rhomboid family serine protease
MGRLRFLVFYVLCGLAAAGAHMAVDPASPIPTVGASGAISGILGAYLVLYPRVRVNLLIFIFFIIRIIPVPAWVVLIYWFVLQVIIGLPQLTTLRPDVSGGVAVWAHIGGFVAGVVLIKLFENRRYTSQRTTGRHRLHPDHP